LFISVPDFTCLSPTGSLLSLIETTAGEIFRAKSMYLFDVLIYITQTNKHLRKVTIASRIGKIKFQKPKLNDFIGVHHSNVCTTPTELLLIGVQLRVRCCADVKRQWVRIKFRKN